MSVPGDDAFDPEVLGARAEALIREGKMQEALPVLTEAARLKVRRGTSAQGVQALLAAAQLAIVLGQIPEAEQLLDEAETVGESSSSLAAIQRVRIQLAQLHAGDEALRPVLERATTSPDRELRLEALEKLADLEQRAGRFLEGAAILGTILEAFPEPGTDRASVLLQRSAALEAAGDRTGALAALDEIDRCTAREPTPGIRSRALGQRAVIASSDGDAERALELASAARQEATRGPDPLAYLAASSLIAKLELDAGHEIAAYDALVRARASLKDLLGPDSGGLIEPAFAALAERLGARWDEVRNAWQSWKKDKQSQ